MTSALADVVVLVHLAFVLFVVCGGLLVLRWAKVAWIHLPAAIWGIAVEYGGFICPLTPLEVALREQGGQSGYSGGFIENYLEKLLYPAALTRELQVVLGTLALLVNVVVYTYVILRLRRRTTA